MRDLDSPHRRLMKRAEHRAWWKSPREPLREAAASASSPGFSAGARNFSTPRVRGDACSSFDDASQLPRALRGEARTMAGRA